MSSGDLSISVDSGQTDQTLIPLGGLASLSVTGTDGNDDDVTLDAGGGAIPIPVSVDGGSGSNSLSIIDLTAGSSWTYDGNVSGTATTSGSDFQPVTWTNIDSIEASQASGTDDNTLTAQGSQLGWSWTIDGTDQGSVQNLDFSGFNTIAGTGNDSLSAPVAVSSPVLGISYSGITTTSEAALDTFTWDGPAGPTRSR